MIWYGIWYIWYGREAGRQAGRQAGIFVLFNRSVKIESRSANDWLSPRILGQP